MEMTGAHISSGSADAVADDPYEGNYLAMIWLFDWAWGHLRARQVCTLHLQGYVFAECCGSV